jgi:hypothetical protein
MWTRPTGLWTTLTRSTVDRQPMPRARAHQVLASGSSNGRGHRTRGGGGRGKHGAPGSGLTGSRKAAERRHDGSEGGGGRCAGERLTRAKREVKEVVRRGGAVRGCCRWLL